MAMIGDQERAIMNDPSLPQRFRWPAPGTGRVWSYGAYFGGCNICRYADDNRRTVGLPTVSGRPVTDKALSGFEWVDGPTQALLDQFGLARADIATPRPILDPDCPRRFWWPAPIYERTWYGCYSPCRNEWWSSSDGGAGLPTMRGLLWIDASTEVDKDEIQKPAASIVAPSQPVPVDDTTPRLFRWPPSSTRRFGMYLPAEDGYVTDTGNRYSGSPDGVEWFDGKPDPWAGT